MPQPPPHHLRLTFAVLTSGVSCYSVLQSLVVPVLPTIQASVHTSQGNVTWVLTAYLLSASIFTPILGRLGDIVGKKRTFVAALVALAAGSVVCALAGNLGVMVAGRVVQGVGGGVLPLAFGIIRDEFPAEKVAGAVGNLASILAVGAGLGIVLAGPIENALDVHWLFWLPAILIVISAVATHLVVPESPLRASGRISVLPAVLLSAWLVFGLLALIVAAALVAPLWVISEQRAAAPLIDMRMMRLPAVWTTNLVALLIGVGMYATFAFVPQFLQTPRSAGYGFGASISESGLIMLPSAAAMFVVGLNSGRMVHAVGAKLLIVVGSLVATASMALMTFAHDEKWQFALATAVMGTGFGMAYAAMSSLIVDAVPMSQTGVASGMNANIRTVGGSIGAALMATIVTGGAHAGALPRESGYTAGFAMLTVATVLAAVAALAIPRLPRRPGAGSKPEHAELALVPGGMVVDEGPE